MKLLLRSLVVLSALFVSIAPCLISQTTDSEKEGTGVSIVVPKWAVAAGSQVYVHGWVKSRSLPATGTLSLLLDGVSIATVNLSDATAGTYITAPDGGTYVLVGIYSGDADHNPSRSGAARLTVTGEAGGKIVIPVVQTIHDVQTASGNWRSWAQLPPAYQDCATPSPCDGVVWSMKFGVASPSLSGHATKFTLGGTQDYGDALFSAQLIGQNSPQLRDADHTLLPTLHHFTYDSYFYVTDAAVTQVLEFDISMYMNGSGMIWGHQCNHLGDGDWDIWNNTTRHWVSAGAPCEFVDGWNHVTLQVERGTDNTLLYLSIELNGVTYPLNKTSSPYKVSSGWWGLTANYQMDGNHAHAANTTYVDNFSLVYW